VAGTAGTLCVAKGALVNVNGKRPAMTTAGEQDGQKRGVRHVVFFVLGLLVFLSLVSYDPADADYLAGGLGEPGVIRNWIGYFGAWVSRLLLLTFGFAAYAFAALVLLASSRRLFGRQGLRRIAWDYWVAMMLVAVGLAMLLGIWPNVGAVVASALNIGGIPGGVFGQRFCAPDGGWIRVILNPTGSAIVALALVVVGLVVVWVHDWQDLALEQLGPTGAADSGAQAEAGEGGAGKLGRWAQRRIARLRERELLQDEAELEPPPKKAPRKEPPEEPVADALPLPVQEPPPPTAPVAPVAPAAPVKPAVVPARTKATAPPQPPKYKLPSLDVLHPDDGVTTTVDEKEVARKKEILQATLDSFQIEAQVGEATSGPRVTLFEVLPAPGVKVERISQISNNIAMELRAVSLRILTPIPGKNTVGIEVPNLKAATVGLRSLMASPEWTNSKAKIPVLLGRNISGQVVILDLTKAPHLLIAGATGSGKSVCINVVIMSLLYRFTPEELRLIMVDPKVVEFRAYEKLPHLVVPVISDSKKVPLALRWVIHEMGWRYQVLAKVGARNLEGFNARKKSPTPVMDEGGNPIPDRLPFIVVIIDELADIMMTAKADVETSLARIAQLSRAVGIHTIIATQRPSVNVLTGVIKANFPTRIAFQVTSQTDSRVIMDGKGAEALLGRGDMLFKPPGASRLERNQGAMVDDDEIDLVVKACADQREQQFDENVFKLAAAGGPAAEEAGAGAPLTEEDEQLVQQAIEIIVRDRKATTSYLQRRMGIGYNRAASMMELLEERGVIGPQVGTAPREILVLGKEGEGATDPDAVDASDADEGSDSDGDAEDGER